MLLAGGRGTRFWPRSRTRTPKQLLNIAGGQTMLRETVSRLEPIFALRNFWVVTNIEQAAAARRELRGVPARHILAEPVGRNTAPAIGLAAFLLLRHDPEAVLGLFPSDHVIAEPAQYRATLSRGIELAAAGENIVVLGIRPTRPETGYGYIEAGGPDHDDASFLRVRRFTEKPDLGLARQFLDSE